jgi:hypothetical protein
MSYAAERKAAVAEVKEMFKDDRIISGLVKQLMFFLGMRPLSVFY